MRGSLTDGKADDLVIIWSLRLFHWFHKGPGIRMSLLRTKPWLVSSVCVCVCVCVSDVNRFLPLSGPEGSSTYYVTRQDPSPLCCKNMWYKKYISKITSVRLHGKDSCYTVTICRIELQQLISWLSTTTKLPKRSKF